MRVQRTRQFHELSSCEVGWKEDKVEWWKNKGGGGGGSGGVVISVWRSREISKSTLLALMSRDADRLLAYGEMPARCVAKVGCRVASSNSEYVPECY